jgi:hypothetical protein
VDIRDELIEPFEVKDASPMSTYEAEGGLAVARAMLLGQREVDEVDAGL